MKKSILIIGMGRLGTHLAEKMQDLGHDVMVLDNKEETITRIATRFPTRELRNTPTRTSWTLWIFPRSISALLR